MKGKTDPLKVFICGPIPKKLSCKARVWLVERMLKKQGYLVVNPLCLPRFLKGNDAMHVRFGMIDVCDGIYFIDDAAQSIDSCLERDAAQAKGLKAINGWP